MTFRKKIAFDAKSSILKINALLISPESQTKSIDKENRGNVFEKNFFKQLLAESKKLQIVKI